MFQEQLSQALSIPVLSIYPSNTSNSGTAVLSSSVDMGLFRRIMAHVIAGVVTGSANTNAYFTCSSTSNGTYNNLTSGNTLTLSASNTEGTLEIRSDQLNSSCRFVKLNLLTNANAMFLTAAVYGGEAPYKPANQNDAGNATTMQRLVM